MYLKYFKCLARLFFIYFFYCVFPTLLIPITFSGFILEGLDLIERLSTSVIFGWCFVPHHKKVQ